MSTVLGPPTQAGYTSFLRGAGFSTTVLPDNSQAITISYNIALDFVSCWLPQIDSDVYTLAVYNFATDRLINYATDVSGQTFFEGLREKYNINAFVGGVISAAADEGTSQSFATPPSLQNLQIMDLQQLKTPWGLTYLQFAQQLGTLWGLS